MRFESQWPSDAIAAPIGACTIGKTCSSKVSASGRGTGPTDTRTGLTQIRWRLS
jgi:hypothetical protein